MHRSFFKAVGCALLWGASWLTLGTSPAQAGFTVNLDSTTPSGSNTVFNYSASIGGTDVVNAGNFFRIYDFPGLVGGSVTAPAGWVVSTSKTDSFIPPSLLLVHGDDPAIENLTFTYKSSTPITGNATLTGFSAMTVLGSSLYTKDFIGQTGTVSGRLVNSIGDVPVPNPLLGPVSPVPEPSSLISVGIGTLLLGFVARRRMRTRPQG